MRNMLIGSRALDYWHDKGVAKPDSDWDVISTSPIEGTEWHDPHVLFNFALERYVSCVDFVDFNGTKLFVVNLKGLAIIKRSHLWRDLFFGKHITQYHKYLEPYTDRFSFSDRILLQERTLATHEMFPQGHPNLNQHVDTFFTDTVTKKYNHDYLHSLLAFYDKPLYTRLQDDPTKAWCKYDKWMELTHRDKIKCVAEEAMVITVERFLVPSGWTAYAKQSYFKSLQKVCTTLTSGWFRDFAIDNYPEIIYMYDKEVKQKIFKAKEILDLMV